jgi:hypothetical protein
MNTQSGDLLLECKSKIEEILTHYKAVLVPVTLISGDRIFSRIDLAPASNNSKDSTEVQL